MWEELVERLDEVGVWGGVGVVGGGRGFEVLRVERLWFVLG